MSFFKQQRRNPITTPVYLFREDVLNLVLRVDHGLRLTSEEGRVVESLRCQGVIAPWPKVVECAGVWLEPDGSVKIEPRSEKKSSAGLDAAPEDAVYLSRQDVLDLAHYIYYIAINHGYHQRHVDERYPGWGWSQLYPVLRERAPLFSRPSDVGRRHLPPGVVGALVYRDGRVLLDDGSLEHAAKVAAWARGKGKRLSDQCVLLRQNDQSPVIVHAPHTSRHVPSAVRRELLLDNAGLRAELAAVTDAGVLQVLECLTYPYPTIVTAAMSRLVFDPERFPVGDPMENAGLGIVYRKRSDGGVLRRELSEGRMDWYLAQYRAYTESMERVVGRALEQFGVAIILDLHSYPREPHAHEDPDAPRPEVCIGTDEQHTPAWLRDAAVAAFEGAFTVEMNTPFSGAYVPGRFHGSSEPVLSVMIEVRRDVLARSGVPSDMAHRIAHLGSLAGRPPVNRRRRSVPQPASRSAANRDSSAYRNEWVSNVCSRCGVRYEFEIPRAVSAGTGQARGYYLRRAAEGICPCCHRPGNQAQVAKRLAHLRTTRRWARRLNDLNVLLVLAGLTEKATSADVKNEAWRVARRLEQYPVEELRAVADETHATPGTLCCPAHAKSEVLRAMVVACVSSPGLLG